LFGGVSSWPCHREFQTQMGGGIKLTDAIAAVERQRGELDRVIDALRAALELGAGEESLLALKVAAGKTGYSDETLRRWLANGIVAGIRRGGRWFVVETSLMAHLGRRVR
jgi:hypothetical protein